jgi:hypothetical protein
VDGEQDDTSRRDAFEAALGSEYFALNGLRGSTTSEAATRASLFFTTLTGTLLALGFLASSSSEDGGGAAVPVAYAAVPMVAAVGFLAFLRLVELAVLDIRALQGLNRIRAHWRGLVPEGADYFPPPVPGQAIDIVLDTGERQGLFRATLTIAATVGLVDSLWIAAAIGFAVADLGAPTAVGVAAGVVVGLALAVAMFRHQTRRISHVVLDGVPTSVT